MPEYVETCRRRAEVWILKSDPHRCVCNTFPLSIRKAQMLPVHKGNPALDFMSIPLSQVLAKLRSRSAVPMRRPSPVRIFCDLSSNFTCETHPMYVEVCHVFVVHTALWVTLEGFSSLKAETGDAEGMLVERCFWCFFTIEMGSLE